MPPDPALRESRPAAPLPPVGALLPAPADRKDLRVRKRDYFLPFILVFCLLAPFDITVEKKTDYGFQRIDRLRRGNTLLDMALQRRVDPNVVLRDFDTPREEIIGAQFLIDAYLREVEAEQLVDWGRLVSVDWRDYEFHIGLGFFRDIGLAGLLAGLLWARRRRQLAEQFIQAEKGRFERLSTELEVRVRESARIIEQLNALQDKLVAAEKLASIGRMSATLAHEIRNPLSIIKSATGIIAEDIPGDSGSQSALELIRDEVNRLDRIISDLLNFARPKEPKLAIHPIAVLVRPWLPPVVEELEKDHIQLVPQFEDESGDVIVDPDQLYQVFLNIMWNARDALRGSKNGHIFVRLADGGPEFIRLLIQDTGPGMLPDVLRQAREPFFTTKTQGTGLGLSVSAQLIEGMGGRLEIESQLDFGTTVTILLPRSDGRALNSPSATGTAVPGAPLPT
jgi:signal transduction histidine kinase